MIRIFSFLWEPRWQCETHMWPYVVKEDTFCERDPWGTDTGLELPNDNDKWHSCGMNEWMNEWKLNFPELLLCVRFFFKKNLFYWRIVDLQCWVSVNKAVPLYIYNSILFQILFHMVYSRMLDIVLCATQQDLVVYPVSGSVLSMLHASTHWILTTGLWR